MVLAGRDENGRISLEIRFFDPAVWRVNRMNGIVMTSEGAFLASFQELVISLYLYRLVLSENIQAPCCTARTYTLLELLYYGKDHESCS